MEKRREGRWIIKKKEVQTKKSLRGEKGMGKKGRLCYEEGDRKEEKEA